MKSFLLFFVLIGVFTACKKNIVQADEYALCGVIAPPLIDPDNFMPDVLQVKTHARQFNYGSVMIEKGMTLILENITPEIIDNYSIHVYLRAGNQYLHLPIDNMAAAYSFSIVNEHPFCKASIVRITGKSDIFEDVIIVAADKTYIQSHLSFLDFENYNVVKLKLGL